MYLLRPLGLHVRAYLLKCAPVVADLVMHLHQAALQLIAAATPASAEWTDVNKFDKSFFLLSLTQSI